MKPFDYVIVGGGAAGCVLANRLSADPDVRVALIEQGRDRNSRKAIVRIPLGMVTFMAPALAVFGGARFMQWFTTEPEAGLGGRRVALPRGRGTGGCTLVNGQIYIRGQRADFDAWRDGGAPGWGFDDLLPYFRKVERLELLARPDSDAPLPVAAPDTLPDPALHGTDGPVNLAYARSFNPMVQDFLKAATMAGHRITADFNGARQAGVGLYTFTQKRGERVTAESAYLDPVRNRPNLTVLPQRTVTGIITDGTRANGVRWRGQNGEVSETRADEVILSAGSYVSPHLLMLSGIGPAEHLAGHGIAPVLDLPGVGSNLQDHLDVTLAYRATNTAPDAASWRAFARNVGHVFSWIFRRRGLFATTTCQSGAFVSTGDADRPDIQLFFCTAMANTQAAKGFGTHGVLMHICELRPDARGTVRLHSADPAVPPVIRHNFFQSDDATHTLRKGIRLVRDIMAQPQLAGQIALELAPGDQMQDDADLDAFLRSEVGTLFHPVGTCAMGTGPDAVVDPATMRVRGAQGLRVVDASVMPRLVSGNTLAATYCLAEKAADLIRAERVGLNDV